jgi:hypothetical protein
MRKFDEILAKHKNKKNMPERSDLTELILGTT